MSKKLEQILSGLGIIAVSLGGLAIGPDATAAVMLVPLGIWMIVKAFRGDIVLY